MIFVKVKNEKEYNRICSLLTWGSDMPRFINNAVFLIEEINRKKGRILLHSWQDNVYDPTLKSCFRYYKRNKWIEVSYIDAYEKAMDFKDFIEKYNLYPCLI